MKVLRIVFVLLLVQIAGAQQPATAVIQGTVVRAGTPNMPLAQARVELLPAGASTPADSIITDSEGRFSFPKVSPGSYRLVASRMGYVNAEYGQRQPNGPTLTLTLAPGQRLNNVVLTMAEGGVISGRATDNGQPVGIADVIALKMTDFNGQPALVGVLSAKTNDLGEYRIFWLPPGQYTVALDIKDQANASNLVVSADGDDEAFLFRQRTGYRYVLNRAIGAGTADNERHVMTFFPGTIDADRAVPVEVRAGAEASNININGSTVAVRNVSGRVNGVPANPGLQAAAVELVQTTIASGIANTRFAAPIDKDGKFLIQRVLPGPYQLVAAAANLLGGTAVEVGAADVNDLVVDLLPGLEVTGNIVIERQTPAGPDPAMTSLRVVLRPEPITGVSVGSSALADGSFKIPASSTAPGVPVGNYRVLVAPIFIGRTLPGQISAPIPTPLQNAYVKSIRLGDRDLINDTLRIERPIQDKLEIVIGTNPGALDGRVMTTRQQAAASVWVALLPDNKLKFKVDHRFTSTDLEGRFKFDNVPPGDYQLYAWEDIEKLAWQEPRLMRPYESRGTAIHIDEGRKTTIEFAAIPSTN
jgi:hypothetical protein